jgi:hypothetical protein
MDFWDAFWLLLIFIPLLVIWTLAAVDIFRRDDLAGATKALWLIVVIVLPFLGTLVYLIFRPHLATRDESGLAVLADLHDRGVLSDAQYAQEKQRAADRVDR